MANQAKLLKMYLHYLWQEKKTTNTYNYKLVNEQCQWRILKENRGNNPISQPIFFEILHRSAYIPVPVIMTKSQSQSWPNPSPSYHDQIPVPVAWTLFFQGKNRPIPIPILPLFQVPSKRLKIIQFYLVKKPSAHVYSRKVTFWWWHGIWGWLEESWQQNVGSGNVTVQQEFANTTFKDL